ncbi:GTPase IMAP family member 9-like isoform X2 [Saccostrea cucullata]|uniref:GTPase IMAP family member 9-like isoform X2 n=1 Tax=Saccostrea cuccullata TaxID=36930 RepID=UPI002ED3D19E
MKSSLLLMAKFYTKLRSCRSQSTRQQCLPIEVLFLGECGAGKSSTINNILGMKASKEGKTFCRDGMTKDIIPCYGKCPPGLMPVHASDADQKRNNPENDNYKEGKEESSVNKNSIILYDTPVFCKVLPLIQKERKKFHAVALVFPMTRYTEDRKKFLQNVYDAFGQKLFKHVIIIFTKPEDLEKDVEDEIADVANEDKLFEKYLSESGNRYIVWFRDQDKRKELLEDFYKKLKDVLSQENRLITTKKKSRVCLFVVTCTLSLLFSCSIFLLLYFYM